MTSLFQNKGLYTDFYELTMAQGYFFNGLSRRSACFDYFFRKLPFDGGYAIFAGLQNLLEYLANLKFTDDDLGYLKSLGFDPQFLQELKGFRFSGSVFATREGEVIFPNEPVLRIEGSLLETQIVETAVLNILNFESLVATKASRLRQAAGHRTVVDFGLRRAQGLGGIQASRAAIIGGVDSTSNVYSAHQFDLKTTGTMAHSWVECFESELDAFRAFARMFPTNCILLVDTYDTIHSGIPNAIRVAHEMKEAGHLLRGVRLDSGDLAYLSKRARAMLDSESLRDVQIIASNQLDEYLIKSLLEQGAPIDGFGVGTSLIVGKNDAALDGVYKLAEFDHQPKLKISENIEKILLPGVKKVSRYLDEEGLFLADAVQLAEEGKVDRMIHPHQPLSMMVLNGFKAELLQSRVMENGIITGPSQNAYDLAAYAKKRLEKLPNEHKRFENPHVYKVGASPRLLELRDSLVERHRSTSRPGEKGSTKPFA